MKLRILGSGTIKTASQKNCSGYLINDELLMEIGPGIWRGLGQNCINNAEIKIIALSHFHADHVSDLAPFLLERYLLSNQDNKNLTIIGPNGLKKWFRDFSNLFGEWMQKMPIDLIEIHSQLEISKYKIISLPTMHTANSLCYRIEFEDIILFYSGDSDVNENIKILSKNADLAIFESSNTTSTKIEGHLSPKLAARIAQQSNAKKLVLTHFYPEVYNSLELKEIHKIYKREIIIAEDNMIIEL